MGAHKAGLGFWINAYCFLTLMGGFYLGSSAFFNLLSVSALHHEGEAVSYWLLLPSLALLVVALLSIYLVYRLIARRNRLTLHFVRTYQLLDLALSLMLFVQLFHAAALSFFVIFELLTNLLWLIFFFRSERVLIVYGGGAASKTPRSLSTVSTASPGMLLIFYCVGLLLTALLFYAIALSPELIGMNSWSGQWVFLFLALVDVFVLYRLFNLFNQWTLNCLRIRGLIGVLYALLFLVFEPSPALFYFHSSLILMAMAFTLYFFTSSALKRIYADKSKASEQASLSFGVFLYIAQTLVGAVAALVWVFVDKYLVAGLALSP